MKNYLIINTPELFQEALDHIKSHEFIAYDTETTGLNVRKDTVIGYGFTGQEGMGYYYPLFKFDVETDTLVDFALPFNHKLLLDAMKSKKLVMHNASYDIRITMNDLKVNYLGSLHADTQLMEHTLDEESNVGLKFLAEKYKVEIGLDEQDASNQEQLELAESVKRNGGKWLKTQKDIYKGDMELIGYYCCADVDMTIRLFKFLEVRLHVESLHGFFYEDEVMPLYKYCTVKMEHRGVYLDMPKLLKANAEITIELANYEKIVIDALMATPAGQRFVQERLEQEFAPKNSGGFAQKVATYYDLPLPRTAAGKFSITKKNLESLNSDILPRGGAGLKFLLGLEDLPEYVTREIQLQLLKESDDSENFINISSKHHLKRIVFDYMGIASLSKTKTGGDQFDEKVVEHIAEKYGFDWATQLRIFNKLTKIQSSYYQRLIDQQEDGIWYPSFKQHGTTSGRYGSDAQQFPKPKEDEEEEHPTIAKFNDIIRELLIPKPGYAYIDDDYESLEPRVFADDAGDEALIKIFTDSLDMYSVVAINAENIQGVSADKKAANFLKKLFPKKRQDAKAYALGIRYGMKAGKLSKTLNISMEEAQVIIDNYFKAFPGLKKKMDQYLREAKTTGKVTSKFGRVRHLPRVKEIYDTYGDGILDYKKLGLIAKRHGITYQEAKDISKTYNGLLNNALNFPIQSAAASLVNRAGIAMAKKFLEEGTDAWLSLQVHDEWVATANKQELDRSCEIVKDCMENTNTLLMPLIAEPTVAYNLREGK
jgi:DNA polymerase I-like protein with 3'-5' exonuclease and polymerase domains